MVKPFVDVGEVQNCVPFGVGEVRFVLDVTVMEMPEQANPPVGVDHVDPSPVSGRATA